MKNSKNEKGESPVMKPLIIFSIIILAIWIISIIIVYKSFSNWTDRGTFGDAFGAINALFSGLAFAGIIYTILLQRQELILQREELRDTRIELKRSADAQESSEKALLEQIKAMRKTAILNGYNSIVEFYNSQAQTQVARGKSPLLKQSKAESYVQKIEILLIELENENR